MRVFQPGGEATPYIENRIPSGEHIPTSVTPYRMSPTTFEIPSPEKLQESLKLFHVSVLRPCADCDASSVTPLRSRGRPRKKTPVRTLSGQFNKKISQMLV